MPRPPRPLRERFATKYTIDPTTGCWMWRGSVNKGGGQIAGEDGIKRAAHRVSYELHVGRIKKGYLIVRTCGRSACVNPTHLLAQRTAEVGAARAKDRCSRGHELREENLYISRSGARVCRACRREYDRSRYDRRREQQHASIRRWRERKRDRQAALLSDPA